MDHKLESWKKINQTGYIIQPTAKLQSTSLFNWTGRNCNCTKKNKGPKTSDGWRTLWNIHELSHGLDLFLSEDFSLFSAQLNRRSGNIPAPTNPLPQGTLMWHLSEQLRRRLSISMICDQALRDAGSRVSHGFRSPRVACHARKMWSFEGFSPVRNTRLNSRRVTSPFFTAPLWYGIKEEVLPKGNPLSRFKIIGNLHWTLK